MLERWELSPTRGSNPQPSDFLSQKTVFLLLRILPIAIKSLTLYRLSWKLLVNHTISTFRLLLT